MSYNKNCLQDIHNKLLSLEFDISNLLMGYGCYDLLGVLIQLQMARKLLREIKLEEGEDELQ